VGRTETTKQSDDAFVLGQRLECKSFDTDRSADLGQNPDQKLADTAPLPVIDDRYGDLGNLSGRRQAHQAPYRHRLARRGHAPGQVALVIDLGQISQL
jgi:hypothetical protein